MNQEDLLLDFTADQAEDSLDNDKELDERSTIKLSNILRYIKRVSIYGQDMMIEDVDHDMATGLITKLRKLKYIVECLDSHLCSYRIKISWGKKENNQQQNEIVKRLDVLEKIVQQIYYAPNMPGAILAQIEFIKENENMEETLPEIPIKT